MESQFVNKKLKQWGVHGQGPSNINCSSVVFICDDCGLITILSQKLQIIQSSLAAAVICIETL